MCIRDRRLLAQNDVGDQYQNRAAMPFPNPLAAWQGDRATAISFVTVVLTAEGAISRHMQKFANLPERCSVACYGKTVEVMCPCRMYEDRKWKEGSASSSYLALYVDMAKRSSLGAFVDTSGLSRRETYIAVVFTFNELFATVLTQKFETLSRSGIWVCVITFIVTVEHELLC